MFDRHQFGLGLRKPHYGDFLDGDAAVPVDFVEVISENFMVEGGRPLDVLGHVRERHPVALHGVSMSIGSADGLDADYLRRLRALADAIDPLFVSDHLSWSRIEGFNSHDLLPLPYTGEALDTVCANVAHAQEVLGRAMLIENRISVAPGFHIGNVFVLAGVPAIARAMLEALAPLLPEGPRVHAAAITANIAEGRVAEGLAAIQKAHPETLIGSYPFHTEDGGTGVQLVVRGRDGAAVKEAAVAIEAHLRNLGAAAQ